MKIKNGRTVMFYPGFVYNLSQFIFFPVNYLISGLCYLQPNRSVWNEEGFKTLALEGSGRSLDQVKEDILTLRDVAYNEPDLVLLYDSLATVSARDDLVGRSWRGKILRTNASVLDLAEWAVIRPLNMLGIRWGKRYLGV